MKKLLKIYGFNSDMQYYEMIINSFRNGQRDQAKNQFLALSKQNRLNMLKPIIFDRWSSGLSSRDQEVLYELILSPKK